MNAKHVLLASLAAASCITFQPAVAENTSKIWIEYSQARGLPIEATPSKPRVSDDQLFLEMSLSDGETDRLGLTRAMASRANGNGTASGNGNGASSKPKGDCPAKLLSEMARTDGNPHGDDGSCDFRAP